MKIVSVILARGGSKGIPLKNIVNLHGKPLISYAIEASKQSNVDETWVSTDSEEIAKVSLGYGSKIQMRPDDISTDISQSEDALIHFAENNDFDVMVFIQPTSPLIKSEYINMGLEMMNDYDSVFSGYLEEWTSKFNSNMKPINWDGVNRPRRQDAKKVYIENGAFYITRKENLLESKCRYSGKIGCVKMSEYESFQIDTYEDLNFLENLNEIL